MKCLTCGNKTKSERNKFCSRKCLYTNESWKEHVRRSTKEAIIRHGTLEDKKCLACLLEFEPWNYKQAICGTCDQKISKKQKLRILRYKISLSELNELESHEKCDLCEKKPQHVDHDHVTSKTRGFLCPACNTALNRLEQDPSWPARARKYLEGAN